MNNNILKKGFIAAGVSNILGVLLFSKVFTNQELMQADPQVMGAFGLVMIIVWGLAYIAVANNFESLKWLVGVFVLEKISYVLASASWHYNNSLSQLYNKDVFAGVFYGIYGINDFIFFLFFAYVFWKLHTKQKQP